MLPSAQPLPTLNLINISVRAQRIELAWLGTESNQFGTDEFIDYAKALGVEPYLCLNSTCCLSHG